MVLTITSLDAEIEKLKKEFSKVVSNNRENAKIYEDWQDVELTYSSNAIEGNTLTHMETALVIEKGISIAGKPVKHHNEAIDLFEAWKFAKEKTKSKSAFGENDIIELHQKVLLRSYPEEAGQYSKYQRRIAGSGVVFPSPAKILPFMQEFGNWLLKQPASPATAFEAHLRLVSVHPFSDGNGRTSRLLMNMILYAGHYPAMAIYPEDRKEYLSVIEFAQLNGKSDAYNELMRKALIRSLNKHIEQIDISKEPVVNYEINNALTPLNSSSRKR